MSARRAMIVLIAASTILIGASSAGAQESEERSVEITFDTGDFDAGEGDWSITVVYVSGDMEDGVPFTVELYGEDDTVLWSGTEDFTEPTTAVAVDRFVAVSEVVEAGVSQALPEVAGQIDERQRVEVQRQGAGGGGGGALALSLVLAVVLLAILFRTPLPSAVSQRWTK